MVDESLEDLQKRKLLAEVKKLEQSIWKKPKELLLIVSAIIGVFSALFSLHISNLDRAKAELKQAELNAKIDSIEAQKSQSSAELDRINDEIETVMPATLPVLEYALNSWAPIFIESDRASELGDAIGISFDDARKLANWVVSRYPKNESALRFLAFYYKGKKQLDLAHKTFVLLNEIAPSNGLYFGELVQSDFDLNQSLKGVDDFVHGVNHLEANSDFYRIYEDFKRTVILSDNASLHKHVYEQLVWLVKDEPAIHRNIEFLVGFFSDTRFRRFSIDALNELEELSARDPQNYWLLYGAANLAETASFDQKGNEFLNDQAEDYYLRIIKNAVDGSLLEKAYWKYGDFLRFTRKNDRLALKHFLLGILINKASINTHLWLRVEELHPMVFQGKYSGSRTSQDAEDLLKQLSN